MKKIWWHDYAMNQWYQWYQWYEIRKLMLLLNDFSSKIISSLVKIWCVVWKTFCPFQ